MMKKEFNWVYQTKQPDGNGRYPVVLMLHGWTGDENSMWVFTPRMPSDRLFIAPRGLYPAPNGGYAWHAAHTSQPRIEDFQPAVEGLFELLIPSRFPMADFSELHLVGFSQGAALAYTITLTYPERVASLAVLSGFLPEDAMIGVTQAQMMGLPIYITHGSRDNLVAVERARQAAELFDRLGAQVSYCEDDVGHKLSATCFKGLEGFYRGL